MNCINVYLNISQYIAFYKKKSGMFNMFMSITKYDFSPDLKVLLMANFIMFKKIRLSASALRKQTKRPNDPVLLS